MNGTGWDGSRFLSYRPVNVFTFATVPLCDHPFLGDGGGHEKCCQLVCRSVARKCIHRAIVCVCACVIFLWLVFHENSEVQINKTNPSKQ